MDQHSRWMPVAAEILNAPTPALARDLFVDELMRQTRADVVTRIALPAHDPGTIAIRVDAREQLPPREHWPVAAQARAHPLSRYYATTTDCSPVRLTDLIAAGWDLEPEQHDAMTALGITIHQMTLPCGPQHAGFDGWAVLKEDGFTDDDLGELTQLQSLLVGLDRHVTLFTTLTDARDTTNASDVADASDATDARTPRPAPDGPTLTPRERLVLHLLATGSTAEGIAARLFISPRTVHKHQENLYRKLRAYDRLSAVLAAQRLGMVPVGGAADRAERSC